YPKLAERMLYLPGHCDVLPLLCMPCTLPLREIDVLRPLEDNFDNNEVTATMSSKMMKSTLRHPKGPYDQLQDDSEFDPEGSVLDYMTWTVQSYAFENRFMPPFR